VQRLPIESYDFMSNDLSCKTDEVRFVSSSRIVYFYSLFKLNMYVDSFTNERDSIENCPTKITSSLSKCQTTENSKRKAADRTAYAWTCKFSI